MTHRGRKSSAEIEALSAFTGMPPRAIAPSGLTKAERSLFEALAGLCSHLVESDAPLLASFCQATALARRAARKGEIAAFERAARLQASLATRLRLTPQSRSDPKTVGRRMTDQSSHPKPWEPRSPFVAATKGAPGKDNGAPMTAATRFVE